MPKVTPIARSTHFAIYHYRKPKVLRWGLAEFRTKQKNGGIRLCYLLLVEIGFQHCSTSSTPIYCVGFHLRRFRCATPAVKHSKAPSALSSQYMSISCLPRNINRTSGCRPDKQRWFAPCRVGNYESVTNVLTIVSKVLMLLNGGGKIASFKNCCVYLPRYILKHS